MSNKINLGTEKARECFIGNYQSWDKCHVDEFNLFEYYEYRFEDGNRLVALRHRTDSPIGVGVIITKLNPGETYVPVASCRGYIQEFLAEVDKKQKEGRHASING